MIESPDQCRKSTRICMRRMRVRGDTRARFSPSKPRTLSWSAAELPMLPAVAVHHTLASFFLVTSGQYSTRVSASAVHGANRLERRSCLAPKVIFRVRSGRFESRCLTLDGTSLLPSYHLPFAACTNVLCGYRGCDVASRGRPLLVDGQQLEGSHYACG